METAGEFVKQVARYQYPAICLPRFLTMLQVYCDESVSLDERIFTFAGFVAQEEEWVRLANKWKERCTKDGITCYHATDCANQWKKFSHLTPDQCIALNADLITYMTETKLVGFGISIAYQDFLSVVASDPRASEILGGDDPYFLAMQMLTIQVCEVVAKEYPAYRLAFTFSRNEKVSGHAKIIFDAVAGKNPEIAQYMRGLSYFDPCDLVPLQVADELAFETMKNAMNWIKERKDRTPILRMKEAKILHRLDLMEKKELEEFVSRQLSST